MAKEINGIIQEDPEITSKLVDINSGIFDELAQLNLEDGSNEFKLVTQAVGNLIASTSMVMYTEHKDWFADMLHNVSMRLRNA